MAFLTVQTVFEGYGSNTFARGKAVLKKFDLPLPMGQDGEPGVRPDVMRKYKTGGTPWTIIIDPKGVVRYSHFHITPKEAIKQIDALKG